MLNTIPNLQFAMDASDRALWTISSGAISEIPSLEATGISAVQATGANQPVVDGDAVRKQVDVTQFMTLPSSVYTQNGDSMSSIRFIVNNFPTDTSLGARQIFASRDDDAGSISIELDNNTGSLRVRVKVRFTTVAQANISTGVPITITHTVLGDSGGINNVSKTIIDQGSVGTSTHDRPSASGTVALFGDQSSTVNEHDVSVTHAVIANTYASDTLLQDVHDFTAGEFQSGFTAGPFTTDGTTLVPEGTAVQHLYGDDNKGTNEVLLETKYTDINGDVTFDLELPTGKVRFIRTIFQENGRDIVTERFFTD